MRFRFGHTSTVINFEVMIRHCDGRPPVLLPRAASGLARQSTAVAGKAATGTRAGRLGNMLTLPTEGPAVTPGFLFLPLARMLIGANEKAQLQCRMRKRAGLISGKEFSNWPKVDAIKIIRRLKMHLPLNIRKPAIGWKATRCGTTLNKLATKLF